MSNHAESNEILASPHKPIPVPDSISGPFWQGAANGRLVIQSCTQCRNLAHPPVVVCHRCGSLEFAYERVSGRGRVYSFTVTRDARNPAFAAVQPYIVAWVELAEQAGLRLICNMPSVDLDRVAVGADVEVFFERLSPTICLPQFRLC